MKKFMIVVLFVLAFFVRLDFSDVRADSISENMGIDVPSAYWGDARDHELRTGYHYREIYGRTYLVAESRLEAAAYEMTSDDDYVAVVYEASLKPYNVNVRHNFLFSFYHQHRAENILVHSDIDNSTYYIYYPYVFYSSAGFTIQDYGTTSGYPFELWSGSAEITGDPETEALDMEFNDYINSVTEYIEIEYDYYNCNLYDPCDYDYVTNWSQQVGGFVINNNGQYQGSTGSFINHLNVELTIVDTREISTHQYSYSVYIRY